MGQVKTLSRCVPQVQGAERDKGPGLNRGTVGGEQSSAQPPPAPRPLTVGSTHSVCPPSTWLCTRLRCHLFPSPGQRRCPVWTSRKLGLREGLLLHHPGGPLSSPQRQLHPGGDTGATWGCHQARGGGMSCSLRGRGAGSW